MITVFFSPEWSGILFVVQVGLKFTMLLLQSQWWDMDMAQNMFFKCEYTHEQEKIRHLQKRQWKKIFAEIRFGVSKNPSQ